MTRKWANMTPVEFDRLWGRVEAMKAEHAAKIHQAEQAAELSRDRQWRKRIGEKAASWERAALTSDSTKRANMCRAFARELRALAAPEI